MNEWRKLYDRAYALDDQRTMDRLNRAWDAAVDALEETGEDYTDEDVAARAVRALNS